MVSFITPIRAMPAVSMVCGAPTNGSTARPGDATSRASGGGATTSTARTEVTEQSHDVLLFQNARDARHRQWSPLRRGAHLRADGGAERHGTRRPGRPDLLGDAGGCAARRHDDHVSPDVRVSPGALAEADRQWLTQGMTQSGSCGERPLTRASVWMSR